MNWGKGDYTRYNGHKLKQERFRPYGEKFWYYEESQAVEQVYPEAGQSPSPVSHDMLQKSPEQPGFMSQLILFVHKVGLMTSQSPFPPE